MTIDEIANYLRAHDAEGRAREQAYWDNERDEEYRVENSVSIDSSKFSNAVEIIFVPYDCLSVTPGKYDTSSRWCFHIRDDHHSSVYFRYVVRYHNEKVIVSDEFVKDKEVWKEVTRTYGGSANFNDLELTEEKIDALLQESAQMTIIEDKISYRDVK